MLQWGLSRLMAVVLTFGAEEAMPVSLLWQSSHLGPPEGEPLSPVACRFGARELKWQEPQSVSFQLELWPAVTRGSVALPHASLSD
jgi:hypothetical protein